MSQNMLIPSAAASQDEANNALSLMQNQDYLPRLKLCQSNAQEVNAGKVDRGGNYCIIYSKDQIEDLGNEVELVVASVRTKALDCSGDDILQYFDKDSPEFLAIVEKSKVKDSECMYGPEYLVWVIGQESFATLFLSSVTARRVATDIHKELGQAAMAKSKLIEGKKHTWWGPIFKPHTATTPNLPDPEEIEKKIKQFKEEKPSEIEVAPESSDRAV